LLWIHFWKKKELTLWTALKELILYFLAPNSSFKNFFSCSQNCSEFILCVAQPSSIISSAAFCTWRGLQLFLLLLDQFRSRCTCEEYHDTDRVHICLIDLIQDWNRRVFLKSSHQFKSTPNGQRIKAYSGLLKTTCQIFRLWYNRKLWLKK
jgi:hypothetical protein